MSTAKVSFAELPEAGEVKNGDFFVIEDVVLTKKIDFKNIIFGLDNVTFAATISSQSTDIVALSASIDSLSAQVNQSGIDLLSLITTTVQTTTANFLNSIYPVGSILYTSTSTNPGILLPNTSWQQVAQGLFIAGVGAGVDKNGLGFTVGAENAASNYAVGEYSHAITAGETPPHTHDIQLRLNTTGSADSYQNGPQNSPAMRLDNSTTYTTQPNVGGSGNNNIPPFYGMYVWKRIT